MLDPANPTLFLTDAEIAAMIEEVRDYAQSWKDTTDGSSILDSDELRYIDFLLALIDARLPEFAPNEPEPEEKIE